MSTVVKSIRFPAPLWAALEEGAVRDKVGTPDFIRQALSAQLNNADLETRIMARLDRQEGILRKIVDALNEGEGGGE